MQKSSPKICDLTSLADGSTVYQASANGNNDCKFNKLDNKQTPSMWIEDGVVCQDYSQFDDNKCCWTSIGFEIPAEAEE